MSILKEIQKIVGQADKGMASLPDLFGPAALGGLLGLFISRGRGLGSGVLLAGGGAALATYLWKKYKSSLKENKIKPPQQRVPVAALPPGAPSLEALRLVRALVFAARSDGHIDAREEADIRKNIAEMRLGEDTGAMIAQVMEEPLEPGLVAQGVTSPEEALQLYLLSCTLVEFKPGPQQTYLEQLAQALGIPNDMRMEITADLTQERKQ